MSKLPVQGRIVGGSAPFITGRGRIAITISGGVAALGRLALDPHRR